MNSTAVGEILQKIDALTQRDRRKLELELAARSDAEWKTLAINARKQARTRGIDQTIIDQAVEQARYGRR